jgi:uncharacterized protein (TIGR02466 family)
MENSTLNNSIEHWWPTPIYHAFVDNSIIAKIQYEFEKVYSDLKFQKKDSWSKDTHLVSDPTFTKNLFEEYNLSTFQEELKYHVFQYVDKKYSSYKISSAWMTLTEPGQYAHTHDHGAADLSGVYYFKTDGNDGDLYFDSPVAQLKSSFIFNKSSRVFYKPEVGKLILFPGWLEHGVFQNTSNENRISISFNIYFIR